MAPDLGEKGRRAEEARRPRDLGRPAAGPGPELGPDLAQVAEPVVEALSSPSLGAQLAQWVLSWRYLARELKWVAGWPGGSLWLAGRYLKLLASALHAASLHRMQFCGGLVLERRASTCVVRGAAARLRTTSIAAARLLARSPQTSIPQVQPRVDAAKREALAGRRYVITETG